MRLRRGQKVRLINLDSMWSKETEQDEINYWKYLLGQTLVCTGDTDDRYYHNDEWDYYNDRDGECDDDRESARVYEFHILDPDGDETTMAFYEQNFEVLDNEPPKDDIEWMDRVQLNFKY
jgi:hypothetical protein